jgi:hypothetical protein
MSKLSRTQADAIVAQLIEIKRTFNREIETLITAVGSNTGRVVRNYDVPTPDAEEVAARWGVDLQADPDDEIPEWVIARYGHLMNDPEIKQ